MARGFEAAGENGSDSMAMMGMGVGMTGQAMNFQQQQDDQAPYQNPFQGQGQQQAAGPQQPPQPAAPAAARRAGRPRR